MAGQFDFSGSVVVVGDLVTWQHGAEITISDGEHVAHGPVDPDGAFSMLLSRHDWEAGALVSVRVTDGLGRVPFQGQVALVSPCWLQCGARVALRVRIVDMNGSPVAGVNVSLDMKIPGNPWWNNRLDSGATSDEGSVVITRYLDPLFVPSRCDIIATPPHGPPVHVPDVRVADLRSDAGVVVELRRPSKLEFVIETSDGVPVSDGVVAVSVRSETHDFVDGFTRPIEDGRAVFDVASGVDAEWCAVGAAGEIQSGVVSVDPGVTRVHVMLDRESPAYDVVVRVGDEHGQQVESATVTVFPERPVLGPVTVARRVAPWDEDLGAHAVRVPREMFPLRIMTFESIYGFGEDVVVQRPDDVDVTVRLRPRGNLRVLPEVVDQFATFRSGPLHVVVRNTESGRTARYERLVGPWSLEWLVAGPYDVFVAMADGAYVGRARATVEAGRENSVEVRLSASAIIEGRVRRGGIPQAGLTVQIAGDSAWHGLPWSRCTTSDTGSFRVTGIPANVVTLAVLDRNGTRIREFTVAPGRTPMTLDL